MSVGHVARYVEEAGVPTVVVMVEAFAHVARRMMLPRTLLTPFPMGRPFGAAGDVERQTEVLDAALQLLDRAAGPGTIEVFDKPFRTGNLAL
ncbi:MAG: hypothetical protein ACR2N2_02105 [Acidimicrobiia bacterium]